MKKTALAIAVCGSLGLSVAHAATVSEFANGVLIPHVLDGGDGNQTAIGLTSCQNGLVYWTFFDVNSVHKADGTFRVTAEDQVNIVWGQTPQNGGADIPGFVRPGLTNTPGYMVFVLDGNGLSGAQSSLNGMLDSSDTPCLAGNAFQIDTQNNDVAFVPALPLDGIAGDFGADDGNVDGTAGDGVWVDNLAAMNEVTVIGLNAGANVNDDIYMRYFIDGAAGGNDTTLYIWSTDDQSRLFQAIQMYDLDQNSVSVNIRLANDELNIIDVENDAQVEARPLDLTDGFFIWTVQDESAPGNNNDDNPGARDGINGVVSWSVIASDAFGAVQTVMNPIRKLDATRTPGAHIPDVVTQGRHVFRVRVVSNPGQTIADHSLEAD